MQSNLDKDPELGYLKNCNACRLKTFNFAKEAGINSTFFKANNVIKAYLTEQIFSDKPFPPY